MDRTVHMWRYRTKTGEMAVPLPSPEYAEPFTVNGSDAWEWWTILKWAGDTGRLKSDDLVEEYRNLFDAEPHPQWVGGRLAADDPIKVAAEKAAKAQAKQEATDRLVVAQADAQEKAAG